MVFVSFQEPDALAKSFVLLPERSMARIKLAVSLFELGDLLFLQDDRMDLPSIHFNSFAASRASGDMH
jgi:hypothetical protein